MKRLPLPLLLGVALWLIPSVLDADSFGGGAFDIDFVTIGDTTNVDDGTGYGAVGYEFRMGVNEVRGGMIDAYNSLSGGPAITRYAPFSASQPATSVSWNEAARFVNWLNTSSGYGAAYNFTTGGANDNITLWTVGDSGYDPANPFRNSNAYYFLPSEDEFYKAAYYDPDHGGLGVGGYWDYATGSDTAPTAVSSGTTAGTAVYNGQAGPADVTSAGGLSPYGTMGQNGNVWEWAESGYTAPNDSAGESRVIRGGAWYDASSNLQSSVRNNASPSGEGGGIGFRVASVPEPTGLLLTLLGAMGLLMKRRRA